MGGLKGHSPCRPTSRINAPYAVVAADSGVESSSSSVMPHFAQKPLCVLTSFTTLMMVSVAALIAGKVEDFAARRLCIV